MVMKVEKFIVTGVVLLVPRGAIVHHNFVVSSAATIVVPLVPSQLLLWLAAHLKTVALDHEVTLGRLLF